MTSRKQRFVTRRTPLFWQLEDDETTVSKYAEVTSSIITDSVVSFGVRLT